MLARVAEPAKAQPGGACRDLCDAVVHSDESRQHAVVAQMVSAGISTADVAEDYVTLAARKLGEAWVDDTLSLAR